MKLKSIFWAGMALALVVAFDHGMSKMIDHDCSNEATAYAACSDR